jgi:hypothetical protein
MHLGNTPYSSSKTGCERQGGIGIGPYYAGAGNDAIVHMPREYWRHLRQAGRRVPWDAWPHEIVVDAIWSLAGPAVRGRRAAPQRHRGKWQFRARPENGAAAIYRHLDRFSSIESAWGTAQTLMLNKGFGMP